MEQPIEKGLSLARRVHSKYSPVFEKLDERERAAVALYFLPHRSQKDVLEVTRARVIKWYCPFADQRQFLARIRQLPAHQKHQTKAE